MRKETGKKLIVAAISVGVVAGAIGFMFLMLHLAVKYGIRVAIACLGFVGACVIYRVLMGDK